MLSLSLTLSLIIILSFHLLFNPFHGSICLIHPIISSHLIIILCILEITQRLVGKPSEEIETVIIETGIQRTIHTLNYVNPSVIVVGFISLLTKGLKRLMPPWGSFSRSPQNLLHWRVIIQIPQHYANQCHHHYHLSHIVALIIDAAKIDYPHPTSKQKPITRLVKNIILPLIVHVFKDSCIFAM